MVQMAGVLVLAAGVPAAADHSDFRAVTLGYFVMRIGLVSQWLRAAIEDPRPPHRAAVRHRYHRQVPYPAEQVRSLTLLNEGWRPAKWCK